MLRYENRKRYHFQTWRWKRTYLLYFCICLRDDALTGRLQGVIYLSKISKCKETLSGNFINFVENNESMKELRYPIGIQTFSEIIQKGYTYVDKTGYLPKLTEHGKYVFPNRRGRLRKTYFPCSVSLGIYPVLST